MNLVSKKRGSSHSRGNEPNTEDIPEPSNSSDYEGDADAILVVSDEGEMGDGPSEGKHALSPNVIDESMILSDEEEPYGDIVVEDDDDGRQPTAKPAKQKMWTTSRNKNKHTTASSGVMAEDKPWRKGSKNRHSDLSQPKSPGRVSQLTNKMASNLPMAPFQITPTSGEAKRPILKYIRGFGVTSPQSPRKVRKPTVTAGAPHTDNWSDNENDDDDHSSISSDMISYSSMDSMDSDDEMTTLPLEDYTHHPEKQPGFWSRLPYIPSHFVHDLNPSELSAMVGNSTNPGSAGCLACLDQEVRDQTLNNSSRVSEFLFALDHRFYLRALFQLLAERDEVGVEDSIHDDQNIIKKGPLRKKYLGKVKVKYLELRKGNLVYFGDDGEERRTVHLRSATASCSAVDGSSSSAEKDAHSSSTSQSTTNIGASANSGGPSGHGVVSLSAGLTSAVNATTSAASTIAGGTSNVGFEFHLWVEGKRYAWLANSKNEQQSWVRAIRQAMIGDKFDSDDWGMTLNAGNAPNHSDDVGATHEEALDTYHKLQASLQGATSKEAYLGSILSLVPRPDTPSPVPSLQVPLKALLDQIPKYKTDTRKESTSQQKRLKSSIAEFWNSLHKFDFAINGHVIGRESPFAAERIIGSLVRCILDFDRCFVEGGSTPMKMPPLSETLGQAAHERAKRSDTNRISELDAVSYARSILLLIIKSKASGDVEFAVENLLKNEVLVNVDHIDPSSALSTSSETLHVDVSFAGDDVIDHDFDDPPSSGEVSGWVMLRRSKYNSWKSRFCVFSEGVFSYYENSQPRPHGLRGQLQLSGASTSSVDDEKDRVREDAGMFILRLTTNGNERERHFGFHNKEEFLAWKEAIEHELESCKVEPPEPSEGRHKKSMSIIEGGTKFISSATDESLKAIKGATASSMKVMKGGTKMMKDATGAFTKGATNLMFRGIRSGRARAKRDESFRSIRRAPSLQFLMESTRTSKTGKREPTVQCVIQTTTDFRINATALEQESVETTMLTVRVKFLQAYLLSGGASGRLARGDATIELDFIEEASEADLHDHD